MSTATLDAPPAAPPAGESLPRPTLTIEEFEELPDGKLYELIDGELVERTMGIRSAEVAGNLYELLSPFVRRHKLGRVFPSEGGYILFPGRSIVRYPDVSFVAAERLPVRRGGFLRLAPDLAFEAVSPSDKAEDVVAKVEEYLRAGVRLVWVAYPRVGVVHAYRPDGSVQRLADGATLAADDLFPGWSAPLAELFADE